MSDWIQTKRQNSSGKQTHRRGGEDREGSRGGWRGGEGLRVKGGRRKEGVEVAPKQNKTKDRMPELGSDPQPRGSCLIRSGLLSRHRPL